MALTSKKLYGVKNDILRKSIDRIDVDSNDELLLLEAPSEYDEIYRALGVNSKQKFVSEQLKDSREITIFQEKYNNAEAFKGNHIKKLCNTYDLRILPISNIEGYLGDDAMKAIKEFTDEFRNTILSDSSLFILAGRECFYADFAGKEVKTFIIFYRDRANEGSSGTRRLQKEHVVNQIYSSGNDFNTFRVFNQLFLKRRYTRGDGMVRWASNALISMILVSSILCAVFSQLILGTTLLLVYLGIMYLNNDVKEYKDSWNGYPEAHNYYA